MKEAFEPSATSANPIASPNDVEKSPIKFKDAVGRKFSFPFHLCKKWEDMEELIKHAFLHVDAIGPDVQEGCYDLIGPDGEIILRQDWETRLEPGWSITMRMWSTAESVSTAPKPSSLLGGASTSKPTQPRAPRQPKPTQPRAPGQSKPNSRLRHILKQMQEYTGPDKGV
ncbi:uncharacterized protein LY89DRAFT_582316 [Mollisia scopiformis]|uniref:Ubiquitin-like domain-containing protein n=1 Tax=Mollisia scopiformis TaxID=149040 RepID=A0A194XFK6_MOLSC|nr:uncharacterized protein LY89DRAFT_582316 [Mollisia scopiformis]KUJ18926.1 hypothetical protein LY89DRAFT_582316 [Mollisia scopiformis]